MSRKRENGRMTYRTPLNPIKRRGHPSRRRLLGSLMTSATEPWPRYSEGGESETAWTNLQYAGGHLFIVGRTADWNHSLCVVQGECAVPYNFFVLHIAIVFLKYFIFQRSFLSLLYLPLFFFYILCRTYLVIFVLYYIKGYLLFCIILFSLFTTPCSII